MNAPTLDAFLASYQRAGNGPRAEVAETVRQLAAAALKVRAEIVLGPTSSTSSTAAPPGTNAGGDAQIGRAHV